MVIHVSKEKRRDERRLALEALDTLALALAAKGHKWTPEQRRLYERAVCVLRRGKR